MKQPSIVIIDYGMGNIYSLWNAIKELGYRRLKISADSNDIAQADALILPGVGAFAACAENLRAQHLDSILQEAVRVQKKPILGICVGMQLMSSISEEDGLHKGLNWIPGKVVRLNLPKGYAVPHVGWNDIQDSQGDLLFSSLSNFPNFYFDHSFHYECDERNVIASCDYGVRIVSAIRRENIFGVQFHPEKSQMNGLKVLRNFFNYASAC